MDTNRKGFVIPVDIAFQFGQYLNGLPWLASGSGLDWRRLSGKTVMLSTAPLDRSDCAPTGCAPCWGTGGGHGTAPNVVEVVEQAGAIYLLRLDERGHCIADTWHESVDAAKEQATFEFGIEEGDWKDVEKRYCKK